ncbi:MAG TPA: hypothetical protein VK467_04070 [Gemmatimonadales bacterium]|nr:hypothetical protein [Gemmatimonadales bacterium]
MKPDLRSVLAKVIPVEARLIELTDEPNDSRDADRLEPEPSLELAQRIARAEVSWLRAWLAR